MLHIKSSYICEDSSCTKLDCACALAIFASLADIDDCCDLLRHGCLRIIRKTARRVDFYLTSDAWQVLSAELEALQLAGHVPPTRSELSPGQRRICRFAVECPHFYPHVAPHVYIVKEVTPSEMCIFSTAAAGSMASASSTTAAATDFSEAPTLSPGRPAVFYGSPETEHNKDAVRTADLIKQQIWFPLWAKSKRRPSGPPVESWSCVYGLREVLALLSFALAAVPFSPSRVTEVSRVSTCVKWDANFALHLQPFLQLASA